jgi:hypothetical protein
LRLRCRASTCLLTLQLLGLLLCLPCLLLRLALLLLLHLQLLSLLLLLNLQLLPFALLLHLTFLSLCALRMRIGSIVRHLRRRRRDRRRRTWVLRSPVARRTILVRLRAIRVRRRVAIG